MEIEEAAWNERRQPGARLLAVIAAVAAVTHSWSRNIWRAADGARRLAAAGPSPSLPSPPSTSPEEHAAPQIDGFDDHGGQDPDRSGWRGPDYDVYKYNYDVYKSAGRPPRRKIVCRTALAEQGVLSL
jgi:hypothetical protein